MPFVVIAENLPGDEREFLWVPKDQYSIDLEIPGNEYWIRITPYDPFYGPFFDYVTDGEIFYLSDPTSVEETVVEKELGFALSNYPNPFNPETKIKFSLPERMFIELSVYNIRGRKIETFVREERETGIHGIVWDASEHPSGTYLYRMEGGNFSSTTGKMILLK